ncbi:MAG: hypothetical protein CM15mP120_11870 [Pseudomonadota bacterium]|nr:MAG: hypothetical protein CM15mP120_11870 [Pseudomonadota bacterium]
MVQGDGSKQALIAEHRRRIDEGEASHLVGVASFSEGLDLPGTTVAMFTCIVKLPFMFSDDPIDQAIAEWAEAQRPEYLLRNIGTGCGTQACAGLWPVNSRFLNIDYGAVTMLDKRDTLPQRYGRALITSRCRHSR